MKKKSYIFICLLCTIVMCSSSDVSYSSSSSLTPVLMKRSDFEQAISTRDVELMEQTSRITLLGDHIFIVEEYRGIHVVDNNDPLSPVLQCFINIPGCIDMAIKDDILYARSAVDLVAIDISDLSQVKEINRVRETFPELGYESYIPLAFQEGTRPDSTIIVSWEY